MMNERRVIAVTTHSDEQRALAFCDDGTVWEYNPYDTGTWWHEVPPVPGTLTVPPSNWCITHRREHERGERCPDCVAGNPPAPAPTLVDTLHQIVYGQPLTGTPEPRLVEMAGELRRMMPDVKQR